MLASDHITGATGKTVTVTIAKNDSGGFVVPAGNIVELGNGVYQVAPAAADASVLGPLSLHATAASCDPVDEDFVVVNYNPQITVSQPITAGATEGTFADLYGQQLNIELSSSSTQLFTLAARKRAINDGMDAFVRLTDCTPRYGNIAVVADTAEYDLETNFADYIRIVGNPSIKRVTTGGAITYIQGLDDFPRRSAEWLDSEMPGWRGTDSGTPMCWYIRDDGGSTYLGLYPPPDPGTETWTILVPYLAQPTAMSADSDYPFTINSNVVNRLTTYRQALVHYGAAVLEPLRKNYTAAQREMALFTGYVAQYLTQHQQAAGDQIRLIKDYYRDAGRQSDRRMDPRRWP